MSYAFTLQPKTPLICFNPLKSWLFSSYLQQSLQTQKYGSFICNSLNLIQNSLPLKQLLVYQMLSHDTQKKNQWSQECKQLIIADGSVCGGVRASFVKVK